MHKFCLILTATIDPGVTPDVKRNVIGQRERDYYLALSQYLQLDIPIVFCENSNYYSELINSLCKDNPRIEYLQFMSRQSYLGKGHGEKEILDYVIAHSQSIKHAQYLVKITGRLYVKNTAAILKRLEKADFMIASNFTRNLTWTDSRFFIFTPVFYKDFFAGIMKQYLNERDKIYIEHCLARAIHLCMARGEKYAPLPHYPEYYGFNASTNQPYNRGLIKSLKYRLYYFIKLFVLRQTI